MFIGLKFYPKNGCKVDNYCTFLYIVKNLCNNHPKVDVSCHPKLDVYCLPKLGDISLPKMDGMSKHPKFDVSCLPKVECRLET